MGDRPDDDGSGGEVPSPVSGSLLVGAMLGQCPRCGARTLFAKVFEFAPRCAACGLDFARFNVGDGPAAFLTLIIGAVITVAAIVLNQSLHPPVWVHAILWIPLTALLVVNGLRIAKGVLLAIEYRRGAREAGGIDGDGRDSGDIDGR